MPVPRFLPCLLLIAASATVGATEPSPWPHVPQDRVELDRFARARLDDVRGLVEPPPAPVAAAPDPTLDCAALYAQRVALSRQQLTHRASFWEDPRSQAGAVIGAVWAPAFYYLPYRAYSDFRAASRAPQVQADIDALRAAAAGQRCFER